MKANSQIHHYALAIITASKLNFRVRFLSSAESYLAGKDINCCDFLFSNEGEHCSNFIKQPHLRSQAEIIYQTLNNKYK